MKRQIKYICNAAKWFDKVNGNTYHSVRITRCSDGEVIAHGWTYGYGEAYKQTALEIMRDKGWIVGTYDELYRFERNNNYPIEWVVSHGLKREMVANGRI